MFFPRSFLSESLQCFSYKAHFGPRYAELGVTGVVSCVVKTQVSSVPNGPLTAHSLTFLACFRMDLYAIFGFYLLAFLLRFNLKLKWKFSLIGVIWLLAKGVSGKAMVSTIRFSFRPAQCP